MIIRVIGCFLCAAWLVAWSPTGSAQGPPIKVRVRLGDVSLNKLPFVVALEEGIYAKNGLAVEQSVSKGAAAVALRNSIKVPEQYIGADTPEAPILIGGGAPIMVGMMRNPRAADRVILGCTDAIVRRNIVGRPEIRSEEELRGKRLGYSGDGSVTHYVAVVYAKKMGWTLGKDVTLVSGANSVEALKTGRVDAFVASELYEAVALSEGYRVVAELEKYRLPVAGSSITVERTWLKDNREAARRFVRSAVEAIALLKKDRQAAFRGMARWYGLTDPGKQQSVYEEVAGLPSKPYPAYEGIRGVLEVYGNKEAKEAEHYFDDSFVRELDKSGFIDGLYK